MDARASADVTHCRAVRPLDPRSRLFVVLLGSLTAMSALSIDMSLPALPLLTMVLHLTAERAQLTLSLFLVGFAVGQTVVGPASDRFGRRPVLLVGIFAFTLAGFGCALSPSGEALIALRFLQGVAASVGPVLGRAMVRDHFSAGRAAELLSSLIVVLAVAPLVAPLLGGRLLAWFDWHAIFWVLGGAGVVLFVLVALFLGESLPARDPSALGPLQLARHVGAFLGNRACLAHALVVLFVFGAQFSYVSSSPFVVIDVFGVPRERFGYFFGATAACLMIGASVNRRLLARVTSARLLRLGLWVMVGAGAVLAAAALAGAELWALFAPLLVFFFGLGLVNPNATAAALEPMPHVAGVASSVLGVFQMTGGAVAGWAVSRLYDHTARPMALAVALLGAVALLAHTALMPPRRAILAPSS
jgi:DHA1 family bicyclomycin/chloramphenicol resistance-like MFS transporter